MFVCDVTAIVNFLQNQPIFHAEVSKNEQFHYLSTGY